MVAQQLCPVLRDKHMVMAETARRDRIAKGYHALARHPGVVLQVRRKEGRGTRRRRCACTRNATTVPAGCAGMVAL